MPPLDVPLLNTPPDVSADFGRLENVYFQADVLRDYDAQAGRGTLTWKRVTRKPRMAFNQVVAPYEASPAWEFPPEYPRDLELPFELSFITPRTIRLRLPTRAGTTFPPDEQSLMFARQPGRDTSWRTLVREEATLYTNIGGFVRITYDPWHLELYDPSGAVILRTCHSSDGGGLTNCEPQCFASVRCASDLQRRVAASFQLTPDEKLYGAGESFTRLNKRGQKLVLWGTDAHGAQTDRQYKPVPFFLSSRGYGMFVHTSAPVTADFGHHHDGTNVLFVGDDYLDLFIFIGSPKDIISEYTALTGRSPLPPLWSFGLWMSRITYKSAEETRAVADRLRAEQIPCDVIHLDTGWFETDWRCDYTFSPTRFPDPAGMIAALRAQGFHLSLWQLPYFTPGNPLYAEAIAQGYVVRDTEGHLPTEDAILDFSNAAAVTWYQGLLARLLDLGIAAIKVDFGEAAPRHGHYASGRSGWLEHNLYPLRYQQAVAAVTQAHTGDNLIWARAGWAGCQRYPVHWGGDPENTDNAMAASLRAGLSLGLCGFSFWSHDIGGFVKRSPRALYRRWLPFGMLGSHARCHGAPPKEPWEYDVEFTADFRRATELRYRLLAYIYAQAARCCERGLPMLRALFVEYPGDPTCWLIEDQYLFGRDLLVAPLFEDGRQRKLYLPPGRWIDYQTLQVHEGSKWLVCSAGAIPVVLLVRDGAIIPHLGLAPHTGALDWTQVELVVFRLEDGVAEGDFCLPADQIPLTLKVDIVDGACQLQDDPFPGQVTWKIRMYDLP